MLGGFAVDDGDSGLTEREGIYMRMQWGAIPDGPATDAAKCLGLPPFDKSTNTVVSQQFDDVGNSSWHRLEEHTGES